MLFKKIFLIVKFILFIIISICFFYVLVIRKPKAQELTTKQINKKIDLLRTEEIPYIEQNIQKLKVKQQEDITTFENITSELTKEQTKVKQSFDEIFNKLININNSSDSGSDNNNPKIDDKSFDSLEQTIEQTIVRMLSNEEIQNKWTTDKKQRLKSILTQNQILDYTSQIQNIKNKFDMITAKSKSEIKMNKKQKEELEKSIRRITEYLNKQKDIRLFYISFRKTLEYKKELESFLNQVQKDLNTTFSYQKNNLKHLICDIQMVLSRMNILLKQFKQHINSDNFDQCSNLLDICESIEQTYIKYNLPDLTLHNIKKNFKPNDECDSKTIQTKTIQTKTIQNKSVDFPNEYNTYEYSNEGNASRCRLTKDGEWSEDFRNNFEQKYNSLPKETLEQFFSETNFSQNKEPSKTKKFLYPLGFQLQKTDFLEDTDNTLKEQIPRVRQFLNNIYFQLSDKVL